MKIFSKEYLKEKAKEAVEIVKDNKVFFFRLGVMVFAAVVLPEMGYCSSYDTGAAGYNGESNPLAKPLKYAVDLFTGPLPAGFTLVSGAVGGMSWGMGWEQQITQRSLKCVGGGAIATGLGKGMQWMGLDNVTGLLFS